MILHWTNHKGLANFNKLFCLTNFCLKEITKPERSIYPKFDITMQLNCKQIFFFRSLWNADEWAEWVGLRRVIGNGPTYIKIITSFNKNMCNFFSHKINGFFVGVSFLTFNRRKFNKISLNSFHFILFLDILNTFKVISVFIFIFVLCIKYALSHIIINCKYF